MAKVQAGKKGADPWADDFEDGTHEKGDWFFCLSFLGKTKIVVEVAVATAEGSRHRQ